MAIHAAVDAALVVAEIAFVVAAAAVVVADIVFVGVADIAAVVVVAIAFFITAMQSKNCLLKNCSATMYSKKNQRQL